MFVSKKRFKELEREVDQLRAAVYNLQDLIHMHDNQFVELNRYVNDSVYEMRAGQKK